MKKSLMAQDQFGEIYGPLDSAKPRADLLSRLWRKTAVPMFIDSKTHDAPRQSGYVISPLRGSGELVLWITLFWEIHEAWHGPSGRKVAI